MRLRAAIVVAFLAALVVPASTAEAQEGSCGRAVIFTLPGVTWRDIETFRPPELLRLTEAGAAGSISVRTNAARTTYASGFATIGAGARVEGGAMSGGPIGRPRAQGPFETDVRVAGMREIEELAEEAGYGAVPGALATAVDAPVIAIGNGDPGYPAPLPGRDGRFTLLAAMDDLGVVELAATGPSLLRDDPDAPFGVRTDQDALAEALDVALAEDCAVIVADQGDLLRTDLLAGMNDVPLTAQRGEALASADEALAHISGQLDQSRDLLLVVSPTAPAWDVAHLGVAIAVGPGFEPGDTLRSASTRRTGVVTLPGVAPTVIEFLGLDRPASMNGRTFESIPMDGDRIATAVALDEESVFIDGVKNGINATFVIFQIAVYLLALLLLSWRERRKHEVAGAALGRTLEAAGLGIVAFPISTFLAGALPAHDLGLPLYVGAILAIDAALVAGVWLVRQHALDRLLMLSAGTLGLLSLDLMFGARLQMNTVFGYSPIVAGRFSGAGNIAFSVLAGTAVLTAALVVHRWGSTRRTLVTIALLFLFVVIVDGAPQFGSDVGGVIALVPGFTVTWMLLAGVRPSLRTIGLAILGAVAAVGVFLMVDLARPSGSRTHLGRLFDDVRSRGYGILWDTISRKAEANLRVFRSSIYTLFVPPALGAMAWLLRRPVGQWHEMAARYPKLWQGMIAGLIVAVFGFATNDSGIVIPAVILSFLVPTALLVHLLIGKVLPEDGA
ncbi:MAG: hypothetical protein GEU71_05455 [Actinobacteria bacterium]|nr:hypothetical protein [Actinomycetota bacterium]